MNRRSAIAALVAMPALAIPAEHTPSDQLLVTVDPCSYRTNPDHKRLLDLVMRRGRIRNTDVLEADVFADRAEVTVLERTSEGKVWLRGGELATHVEVVSLPLLGW